MKKVVEFYRLFNVLSLDVTAGAMVSALFFAGILRVHLLIWAIGSLGLTVWTIYTVDHLIDARRVSNPASSRRHRFHQDHFRWLVGFVIIAVVADGIMITYLRTAVLHYGLGLAAAVGLYFIFQRKLRYIKEFCGAILYSGGVLLPAWSLSPISISASQGIVIAEFGITVLCNLILFSLFDQQSDLHDRQHSLVTVMGNRFTRILLSLLFAINGILIVFQLLTENIAPQSGLIILMMNSVLLVLFIFPERFEIDDRYRLLGDAIFLLPALFFLSWL